MRTREHFASLPFRDVADSWNINLGLSDNENSLGSYRSESLASNNVPATAKCSINLRSANLSVWAHELIHASEDRLRELKTGQHADQEIVAELGGAVLLAVIGKEHEADLGRVWSYIKAHSAGNIVQECNRYLDRICKAVELILTTAERLNNRRLAA